MESPPRKLTLLGLYWRIMKAYWASCTISRDANFGDKIGVANRDKTL